MVLAGKVSLDQGISFRFFPRLCQRTPEHVRGWKCGPERFVEISGESANPSEIRAQSSR